MAKMSLSDVSLGSITSTVGQSASGASQGPIQGAFVTVDIDQQKAQLKQDLLISAKELLPDKSRVQSCMAIRVRSDEAIGVEYAANSDRSRLTNLCTCGNVWQCPNCGSAKREKTKRLLQEDFTVWSWEGYTNAFAVFTIQHERGQRLADVDGQIDRAIKKMMDNRAGREFKKKWSIAHRQRSPDVTYGNANGWHSHRNFVFYFKRRTFSKAEIVAFEAELSRLWQKACQSVDAYASLKHGAVVKFEDVFNVADYIASKALGAVVPEEKYNPEKWGLSAELTKHEGKVSEGRTPTDLLTDYAFGDEKAGWLWREYAHHFKGKKFVDSTPGLRALLDGLKEKHSDRLSEFFQGEELPEYQPVLYLSPAAFKKLGELHLLYWFLLETKRCKGNAAYLRGWLQDWEITEAYAPQLDKEYPDWWLSPEPDIPKSKIELIREGNKEIERWNNWEL